MCRKKGKGFFETVKKTLLKRGGEVFHGIVYITELARRLKWLHRLITTACSTFLAIC